MAAFKVLPSYPMQYFDAHLHLHDSRLDAVRADSLEFYHEQGVAAWVVNGTSEADWSQVAEMAKQSDAAIPAFGVHPWKVKDLSPDWLDKLIMYLRRHPDAAVGEVGLDKWVKNHAIERQKQVLAEQVEVAIDLNRPLCLHCLQAWGAMIDLLEETGTPQAGILLHAFGGPKELVSELVDLGAYFSFSGYYLKAGKEAVRDIFADLPEDRVLVETDAPDMAMPKSMRSHHLLDESGKALNHPANLVRVYEKLAELRGVSLEKLTEQVEQNFRRLFGQHA